MFERPMTVAADSALADLGWNTPLGGPWSNLDELRRAPLRDVERWLERTLPLADDDPRKEAAAYALARLGLPAFFVREKPPLKRLYRRPAARFITLTRALHFDDAHDFDSFLRRPGALRFLLLQFCGPTLLRQLALERGRSVRIFDPVRGLFSTADVALSLFCDSGLSEGQLVERLRREYELLDRSRITDLRRRTRTTEFLAQLPQSRMQFGQGQERALNHAANFDQAERREQLERLLERREQHDAWSFVKTDLNAVLEDIFFGHQRVCPRLEERVAHSDLLLRESDQWHSYDLKSTYLPSSFIHELRLELGLDSEDLLLRRCLREEAAADRLELALTRNALSQAELPVHKLAKLVTDLERPPKALRVLRKDLETFRGEVIARLATGEELLVRRLLSHLYTNQGRQRYSNNPRIIVVAATKTLAPNDVLLLADLKRLERAVAEFLDEERAPLEISYEQRMGGLGVVRTTHAHLIFIS